MQKHIGSYEIIRNHIKLEKHSDIWYTVTAYKKKEVDILDDYMDRWIGIDEVAEYLGVNKDTIRNWIKKEESKIPAHKIGKQWKFKRSELDDWVKSGKSAIDERGLNHENLVVKFETRGF